MRLSTPAAVVLGATIIGAGLAAGTYCGMRAPRAAAAATAASVAPAVAPSSAAVPRSEVEARTRAAIEPYRAAILRECWEPERGARRDAPGRWKINFTFGADGAQLARGVAVESDESRHDLTPCAMSRIPPLRIAPPGETTRVEVPFSLP